jgi:Putative adhesin
MRLPRPSTRQAPSHLEKLALIPFLLLLPANGWSASSVQRVRTFSTISNPDINLTNLTGTVIVRGWTEPRVHAVYTLASPRIEIDTTSIPETGQIQKVELATHLLDPTLQGARARVDYTMDVPVGSSVEIRNPQGVVRIERLNGDTWAASVGGSIFISDSSGEVVARSVGGEIQVVRSSGYVEVSSVTGDLKFLSPMSSRIRAETTSGQIFYEGNLFPAANYVMETYSGDINVLCPRSSSFELAARSVHGKVIHELKVNRRLHHESVSGYGNALYGTHNEGAASLELTSFRGNIYIRPEPQQ